MRGEEEDEDGLKFDKEAPMASFKQVLQFSECRHKVYAIVGSISAILAGWSIPMFVIFLSDLYESFGPDTSDEEQYDKTQDIGLIFFYIGIGMWVVSYLFLALWGMVSEYTGMIYRVKYLESVLRQDIQWFEENDPQSLAAKISQESTAIQAATGEKIANIIMSLSMCMAGFVFAFYIGWKFTLVTLVTIPINFGIIVFLVIILKIGYKKGEAAFKASSTKAEQALTSIKVVAAFGQEKKEEKRFNQHLESARKTGVRFHMCTGIAYGLNNGGFLLMFTYAVFMGGVFVSENIHNDIQDRNYRGSDAIAIFFGLMLGTFSLGIAAPNFKSITKGRQAAYSALETINRTPEIEIDDPNAKKLEQFEGEVEFNKVSFTYKTRQVKALDNVSMMFEKGKVTALVGPSGSGKSTIVQLMERFYDPQEGEILIDGVQFPLVNLKEFRSKVGYVGQEPVLFNQTIKENILYGKPDATDEEIATALDKANATKIIERLPDGVNTLVGAGGGQLSGGEKQRIALARAFVKDPKILILDEATSALDRKNEKEVQEAIDDFKNGDHNITTIIIAHRLSTIINSDKIIVLKEGKVVEVGSHENLLSDHPDGVYASLVRTQQNLEDDSDNENDDKAMTKKSSLVARKSSFKNEVNDKKAEADEIDEKSKNEKEEFYKSIEKKGYFKRLLVYNKPCFLIYVGLIGSAVQGISWPVFAVFYVRAFFATFEKDLKEIGENCLVLVAVCICSIIGTYFQKMSFGILAENVTKEIRRDLYYSLLRKHIGWFDKKENNIGVLTGVMSSDVYTLNGASTEGISTLIETLFGLVGGIIIAFFYDWRTTLVALALCPFIICGAAIQVKLQSGLINQQDEKLKDSNLLISDAITNYKTVASFGNQHILVDILKEKLEPVLKSGMVKAHIAGIVFGYSSFMQNIMFGVLFFVGAVFVRYEGVEDQDSFTVIFVILFAAFAAGQAQQFGPSAGKAYKSALRIFSIIDEKSETDIDLKEDQQVIASKDMFVGEIEFKNVWFRYPTRPDIWILKDFNLKIKPCEHIALVGESGSGKSTIVQLLYRFYEPHFGQIYIDGVNIKDYDLVHLRALMGLVQQEPVLFNESVLYNICYSIDDLDEDRAIKAARISNASGFIAKLTDIRTDEEEGKIIEEQDEDDDASDEAVRKGLGVNCGTKGGKLSGGQKQRIAIARAIIRQPKLLLLDEATSALDEVSQHKVQEALEKVMVGRTSIVIAHRLTTIENCDRIVILKNGIIHKEGKFAEVKNDL